MIRRSYLAALTTLALAGAPSAASAHVTLQPHEVPAGQFQRLDVRVPNERDDASTTKVEVQFPPGFIFVSYEPVAGWTATVKMARLSEPVEAFGEQHREQVDTITFATRGSGIAPGQFRDFGLSVGLPDRPGTQLTFKALQTYSSGEVVRWIGAPESEEPAPRVMLTAASAEGTAAHGADTNATAATTGDEDDDADGLATAALVLGALGLLAGLGALLVARRSRATARA